MSLALGCVTETTNVSVLFYKNLKSSILHDSHIWLWGFFTLLDGLAHGVALYIWPGIKSVKGITYQIGPNIKVARLYNL